MFKITFGRICNINAIYNIFPDGDSNPIPQNSSQADKYLTNMAVTDPTKERDTVRLLLKRSCLSPGGIDDDFNKEVFTNFLYTVRKFIRKGILLHYRQIASIHIHTCTS